ncbi:MAG: sigma-70 family RNA polymerase sigma factor [Candidatus Krumholzibacteriia bacterium]
MRRREPAAMERFFDLYYDRLFGHVVRLVGNVHLAEDLTHDVFLRLNRVIDRLDPDRDPTAGVFTIATNVVRDHWRSRGHKDAARGSELTGAHLEVLADEAEDAEAQLVRRQEQARVRQALAELSDDDREVILLRDFEGLDSALVGEILGLKADAVRQRHKRAVGRLGLAFRKHLDPDGAAP